jgi:hypothetical protein
MAAATASRGVEPASTARASTPALIGAAKDVPLHAAHLTASPSALTSFS